MFGRLSAVNLLQEGEISADLFTFHEAVSQLQLLEEEVLDAHASLAEMGPLWTGQDNTLLAMTNDVDYDQDGEFTNSCSHRIIQKERLCGCRKCCTISRIITAIALKNIGRSLALETFPSVTIWKLDLLPKRHIFLYTKSSTSVLTGRS
jgi:hypothetical protein